MNHVLSVPRKAPDDGTTAWCNPIAHRILPFALSVIAGSVDVIGFLGLDGLFTAHITGNLVILVSRLLAGRQAPIAHLLAVPVFVAALLLTKLAADALERFRISPLIPLLLLHLILLSTLLVLGIAAPVQDPDTAVMIVGGMLGVSAMAVQNGLVRIALPEAPSTAVMTTNVTLLAIDAGEMLIGRDPVSMAKARNRAGHTLPAIAGFLLGCALGGSCEKAFGLRALGLPAGLAVLAIAFAVLPGFIRGSPQ